MVEFVFFSFFMGPRDTNCFWLLERGHTIFKGTEIMTVIQTYFSIPKKREHGWNGSVYDRSWTDGRPSSEEELFPNRVLSLP